MTERSDSYQQDIDANLQRLAELNQIEGDPGRAAHRLIEEAMGRAATRIMTGTDPGHPQLHPEVQAPEEG